jgi:uncharacterized lipoprotein NlpE involved in copper resistance
MPDLPTVTVSAAKATRILDAYKAKFGTTTQEETAAAYRTWLMEAVKDVVLRHESQVLDEAANRAKQDALEALDAELSA